MDAGPSAATTGTDVDYSDRLLHSYSYIMTVTQYKVNQAQQTLEFS